MAEAATARRPSVTKYSQTSFLCVCHHQRILCLLAEVIFTKLPHYQTKQEVNLEVNLRGGGRRTSRQIKTCDNMASIKVSRRSG